MKNLLAHSLLLLAIFFWIIPRTYGQDPQWSQFYSNLLMLNPAFAGSGSGPRIAMNYRAQWVRIPGSYQQGAFSYDQPFFIGNTTQGAGVNVAYDRAGEGNLSKIDLSGNYAFQVDLTDEHILRFGLGGGLQQATIDFYKLRFPDQIDPRDGVVRPTQEPGPGSGTFDPNQIRFDFSAGVSYFNEFAWIGFTVNHLTQPEQRFYDKPLSTDIDAFLPRKYTVTGGLRLPVGPYNRPESVTITPTFLYKSQGQFSQFDIGLYVDIEPMVFGMWYRNQDALIGLIGIRSGPFSFGYSYDYTISDLTQGVSGGSHEVSMVLEFEQYRNPRFKHKAPPCPKF